MRRLTAPVLFLLFLPHLLFSQTDTIPEAQLPNVYIRSFEQNRRLKDIPASINYVSRAALERFSPTSIVQAVNTTPGIRMEERSPGSYRINIRGSALRSPFGVRNVKVYFNDIPITDPGGHTYLNQLGYYNFNSLEIIKGPGNSLYGAGTGGVMLIESLKKEEPQSVFTEIAAGSFGLKNYYGSITTASSQTNNRIGIQHQVSDGYRNHSELKRTVLSWSGNYEMGQNKLKTTFLFGDLFYETPGALTKAEFDANPQASRPGNAFFPGAETARASISQKQLIAGASYDQQLSEHWKNRSVVYGMFTDLRNPTIQNYGHSSEPHFGGRSLIQYGRYFPDASFRFDFGGEIQQGFTSVSIHKNASGVADTLRTFDEIKNRQALLFSQLVLEYFQWSLTAGTSLNFLKVNHQRFTPATRGKQIRRFNNELAPRIALMRKFGRWNVYSSISKGFSPPTTAELLPTGGAINLDLNAEKGVNFDAGLKVALANGLYIDVNAFLFQLENTIVQRRTAGGGDFFINAGNTDQKGIETFISYPLLHSNTFLQQSSVWLSHTFHYFRYSDFKQLSNDFSGNRVPGVPPHVISTGVDFHMQRGLLGSLSYYFSDKLPVNDANSEFANAFHIIAAKVGYQYVKNKWRLKGVIGADNLLDQRYSLGNDVNGFGGRYYNAAAGRNYYTSIIVQRF